MAIDKAYDVFAINRAIAVETTCDRCSRSVVWITRKSGSTFDHAHLASIMRDHDWTWRLYRDSGYKLLCNQHTPESHGRH